MEKKIEKNGCVYFLKHNNLSPIKIGFSASATPSKRLVQLKVYAPYGAEVVGFIRSDNAIELEKILHLMFSDKRMEGEWFNITKEDVDNIISIHTKKEESSISRSVVAKNDIPTSEKVLIELRRKSLTRDELAEKLSVNLMTINRRIDSNAWKPMEVYFMKHKLGFDL